MSSVEQRMMEQSKAIGKCKTSLAAQVLINQFKRDKEAHREHYARMGKK